MCVCVWCGVESVSVEIWWRQFRSIHDSWMQWATFTCSTNTQDTTMWIAEYPVYVILMAWSCGYFDNGWRCRWRRCWNYHFLDGANVIFDLNEWLFWILETTFGASNGLYIQTRFHFYRDICRTEWEHNRRAKKTREKFVNFHALYRIFLYKYGATTTYIEVVEMYTKKSREK